MDVNDIFFKLSAGTRLRKKHLKTRKQITELPQDINISSHVHIVDSANSSVIIKQDYDIDLEATQLNTGGNSINLLKTLTSEAATVRREKKKRKKVKTIETLNHIEKEKNAEMRNKNNISVLGKNIPELLMEFDELGDRFRVSSIIMKNIALSGYITPTSIQMQALPLMFEGRQVLACAPTGSGKTAAFLIPIIHSLKEHQKVGFRAVVVCPTRELASQTYRECLRLTALTGLRTNIVSKISHSTDRLRFQAAQKYDILISTPNRLVYLLKQEPPMIVLKKVEWLVVDESDKLFESGTRGFRDQLAVIYNACDSMVIKRAMFSATQTPHLTKWCRKNLRDLACVNVGVRNSAAPTVEQELLFVGSEHGKLIAIRDLVRKGLSPPVLVFVQSKERAQELFSELIYDGINVDVIHSDRSQTQRDNVIRCFREGKIWVLICTELMGRGIDFKGVNLVINYDFPPSGVSYVHRIGRTGRAGRPGRAITYFTQDDTVNLRSIAGIMKSSGCDVPEYMLTMRKPNRADKKKLEQKAPRRSDICTTPVYQNILERRKQNASQRTKRIKSKLDSKT